MNGIARTLVITLTVLAVILTATAISAVKHAQELNEQLDQAQAELQKLTGAPAGQAKTGSSEMLQKLLAEETAANAKLRKEIARLKNLPATVVTNEIVGGAAALTNAPGLNRAGRGNAWMERMRQEDPERYKQIVADREQRQKEATDWYDSTQNQLAARAQAAASPTEADLATQISNTLSKLSDLRQQMQALAGLPEDQQQAPRSQLMPELQTALQQLSQLREQDRTLQYQQLATQLGLTGDKATALATTIPQILQNTQYMPPRGQGGGGFGFGGPPGTPAPAPTAPATGR